MPWNDGLTELQYELAGLYFRDERIRSVAVEAGIPPEALDLDGAPVTDWHNVLTEAANRGNVADLVAIAIDEYPTRVEVLSAALAKHEGGVGSIASTIAEFQRLLANNLRQVMIGIVITIATSWIVSSSGDTYFRREFVIFLQISVIALTPFVISATLTRFRISVSKIIQLGLIVLIMLIEAALFSEIASDRNFMLLDKETERAVSLSELENLAIDEIETDVFQRSADLRNDVLKSSSRNTVKVRSDGGKAVLSTVTMNPLIKADIEVEWTAEEDLPGLTRNFIGKFILIYEYDCSEAKVSLQRIQTGASFHPGKDPRTWLVGFIQIPYLKDSANDVLGTIDDRVKSAINDGSSLCSE